MCGRFNLRASPALLAEIFQLLREPDLQPRYNIAPTQSVAVIRPAQGGRELSMLHWGLIPSWAKDPKIGARMINARADTVATKPAFRAAFKQRRCLIPATGFYEWKKLADGTKQPYQIGLRDGQPFAFAGLWESWKGEGEQPLESCTIITGQANALMRDVHDRMPVILDEEDYDRWLDPRQKDVAALESLLVPYPADRMRLYPISTVVNNPRNERAECIEPLTR
jgi:putative SOS response-associated peptidase YedK